ncbi:MAG: hypothetical protein R2786_00665 [Flavobacteriaceae bacterium]
MKYFLVVLFTLILITLCVGFYIKTENFETGNLLIGLSVAAIFLVLMPLFIYHRWKDKNVKDYMLTKENIEKMRDYSEDKKL